MSAAELYHPEPSIPLDYDIRFNPDLTWGEKVFYAEIKSMCAKGKCYYHQSSLAEMFNVAPVSIHTWIKKLCTLGFIDVSMDSEDPWCRLCIKLKDRIERVK